jgi:hypothetical protein
MPKDRKRVKIVEKRNTIAYVTDAPIYDYEGATSAKVVHIVVLSRSSTLFAMSNGEIFIANGPEMAKFDPHRTSSVVDRAHFAVAQQLSAMTRRDIAAKLRLVGVKEANSSLLLARLLGYWSPQLLYFVNSIR